MPNKVDRTTKTNPSWMLVLAPSTTGMFRAAKYGESVESSPLIPSDFCLHTVEYNSAAIVETCAAVVTGESCSQVTPRGFNGIDCPGIGTPTVKAFACQS